VGTASKRGSLTLASQDCPAVAKSLPSSKINSPFWPHPAPNVSRSQIGITMVKWNMQHDPRPTRVTPVRPRLDWMAIAAASISIILSVCFIALGSFHDWSSMRFPHHDLVDTSSDGSPAGRPI
jgi:hypothetical protein